MLGHTHIAEVEDALGLNLDDDDADTVAGVLMSRSGKLLAAGDKVDFEGATAVILSTDHDRVEKIRFTLDHEAVAAPPAKEEKPQH